MQIYLQQDGTNAGPFDETVVRERLNQGILTPNVYAWREGLSQWQTLGEVLAVTPPSFNAPATAPLPPEPATGAVVKGRHMPWWGKTLLGCGGLVALAIVLLATVIAYALYQDHHRGHDGSSTTAGTDWTEFNKEMATVRAQGDKDRMDLKAEMDRAMADTEHYATTQTNDPDGGSTTTVVPKSNAAGAKPITKRVDADGKITTITVDAQGNTVTRTEDKNGNVSTVTTGPKEGGPTSRSVSDGSSRTTAQTTSTEELSPPSIMMQTDSFNSDRQAAEDGDAMAQVRVSIRYLDGNGVGKDPETALQWFRKSAEAATRVGR